ncbi:Uma2 family endonuclease [Neolewinella antarctica]|uniref:Uma2 family endonuclease n=1 Tax=Neolewinella antarctica TaxID=442734 RepID=A0ABX0XA73_9BACT|nr:Uma2 family endonuclease [Neolewinella antarctica]NJC25858.1 Uma2 family endonuclease [Neolewinella antarctica]
MTKAITEYGLEEAPRRDERFRWTLERYHLAITAGVITPLDRVELVRGKLKDKMGLGVLHSEYLYYLTEFIRQFAGDYKVRAQDAITLPPDSEPEPDLAVVTKKRYTVAGGHPGPEDVFFLAEVSHSTLSYDIGDKAQLFAGAGIREYWIIDVKNDQIIVHLSPNKEVGVYNSIARYSRGENFESQFCGMVQVEDALMPFVDEV